MELDHVNVRKALRKWARSELNTCAAGPRRCGEEKRHSTTPNTLRGRLTKNTQLRKPQEWRALSAYLPSSLWEMLDSSVQFTALVDDVTLHLMRMSLRARSEPTQAMMDSVGMRTNLLWWGLCPAYA